MKKNIVVLSGAGISAESGLRTFRASDGLWEEHRIEDVATPEGFARNPERVQGFYNERRRQLNDVKPNAAHVALAEYETCCNGDFLLVTQNIDDLHERAGSQSLVHMHGELLKMFCTCCTSRFGVSGDITPTSVCPNCKQTATLRPDIVWFGEMPYQLTRIEAALADCNLFVSIGTSGNVYPAAGFVQLARRAGAVCVELNLERSAGSDYFDRAEYGSATTVVPAFFSVLATSK